MTTPRGPERRLPGSARRQSRRGPLVGSEKVHRDGLATRRQFVGRSPARGLAIRLNHDRETADLRAWIEGQQSKGPCPWTGGASFSLQFATAVHHQPSKGRALVRAILRVLFDVGLFSVRHIPAGLAMMLICGRAFRLWPERCPAKVAALRGQGRLIFGSVASDRPPTQAPTPTTRAITES